MEMALCCYKNCANIQVPFSKLSFFALPKDGRREFWIGNSGNDELKSLPLTAKRFFCENHFDPKHLRRQFNRTILYRDAVPLAYQPPPDPTENKLSNLSPQYLLYAIETSAPSAGQNNEIDQSSPKGDNISDLLSSIDNRLVSGVCPDSLDHSTETLLNEAHEHIAQETMLETVASGDNRDKNNGNTFVECLFNITDTKVANATNFLMDTQSPHHTESIKSAYGQHSSSSDAQISSTQAELPKITLNADDKYFALSMFGTLRRLTPLQQQAAKLHILTYLTKLEYGENASLE